MLLILCALPHYYKLVVVCAVVGVNCVQAPLYDLCYEEILITAACIITICYYHCAGVAVSITILVAIGYLLP